MSLNIKKNDNELLKDLKLDEFEPYSIDDFLGGQVRLIQMQEGYRAGQDAVLLAASIPAVSGDVALDLGAGTGVVALCLAHRCKGVNVMGLEIQELFCRLAKKNIMLNGLKSWVEIIPGSILDTIPVLKKNSFDHVFSNPPYLHEDGGIAPVVSDKKNAYLRIGTTLADWVDAAIDYAKPKGTVTFVFRADQLDDLISLLADRIGDMVVFPLWPREGVEAKRILIQGRKGTAGGATLAPGICLHGTNERYSKQAEAVLRDGKALSLCQYGKDKKSHGLIAK